MSNFECKLTWQKTEDTGNESSSAACCCSRLHGVCTNQVACTSGVPRGIRGQTNTLKVWAFCNCVCCTRLLLLLILSYIFSRKTLTIVQKFHICFSFLGSWSPRLPTGALPLDPTGGPAFPIPLNRSSNLVQTQNYKKLKLSMCWFDP